MELLGIEKKEDDVELGFKLPEISESLKQSEVYNLKKLVNKNWSQNPQLISDMTILKDYVELNTLNQLSFKKKLSDRSKSENERQGYLNYSYDSSSNSHANFFKAKLVTIILNKANRPRYSMRILLNKRNTANLDVFLNELTYLLRLETQIKKIFNLNGEDLQEVRDLFFDEKIFLVTTSDKLNSKDLELDLNEIREVYANELMKSNSTLNPETLLQKHQSKQFFNMHHEKRGPFFTNLIF